MADEDEIALMTHVAREYHLEGKSRVDIAEALGISRFKVARLLDAARERGIVTITVKPHGLIDRDLSTQLAARFGLRDAVVVWAEGDDLIAQLGEAAARRLEQVVTPGDVLGFDTGRTVGRVAENLRDLPAVDVVQLSGLAGSVQLNGLEILRRVAEVTRGAAYPLYAPMLAVDPRAAELYRRQHEVVTTMGRYPDLTVAVISVGSWTPPESQVHDALAPEDRERLRAEGVLAESCALMFDVAGRELPGVADRRVGITADELRAVRDVVAVAGGERKAGAIHALLRSGLVDTLVTDAATARAVLAAQG